MKILRGTVIAMAAVIFCVSTVSAHPAGIHPAGSLPGHGDDGWEAPRDATPAAVAPGGIDLSLTESLSGDDRQDILNYTGAGSEELWEQFAEAEAYKKLYELQEHAIHEQIRLLEGPPGHYANGYGENYSQLQELKNKEYAFKIKKEQYEMQKKQAEANLKLSGERLGKAELEYALYAGIIEKSGLEYEELYTRRYELQLQERQQEIQLQNLEYQRRAGELSDSSFVSQYASAFRQKEILKMERETADAELRLLGGEPSPRGFIPLP